MPDFILAFLSGLQRTAVTGLAAELRAGGLMSAVLAFALGALHALTPGHGKAALAAYFLGRDAKIATGLRVTLAAAFLHVLMGFAAFLVLRFAVSQTPFMAARGSPMFAVFGYGFIFLAGVIMIVQSLWRTASALHPHALTLGVGLLPCPLTIMVLGFAWVQSSIAMVVVVLFSLAFGIALTIGSIALIAIVARGFVGPPILQRIPNMERGVRILQAAAGALIAVIAASSIWSSV